MGEAVVVEALSLVLQGLFYFPEGGDDQPDARYTQHAGEHDGCSFEVGEAGVLHVEGEARDHSGGDHGFHDKSERVAARAEAEWSGQHEQSEGRDCHAHAFCG